VSPVRTKGGDDRWRAKLHAVFFELAELNKEFEHRFAELRSKAKEGLSSARLEECFSRGVADLNEWFEEHLTDINQRYAPMPYNPLAFGYFTLDTPISDGQGLAEYLHFHRHGEALRVTAADDALGDLEAYDKIARTGKELRQVLHGKGPIKSFQENPIHRQLLQILICFEKEALTAEELAECFDHFCACGKDHDADNLRKMRNRLEADLRKNPAKPL
jgi:hypothetical protein